MHSQKIIMVPTQSAELSWKPLLADPDKHWRDGYSAKSAADSWENAKGMPLEIRHALNKSEDLADAEVLLVLPEFKVPLPGGNRPSQNDIFALARNADGLTVLMVEAKVRENFDKLIGEWLVDASQGKTERLNYLCRKICFPEIKRDGFRYQLFHRFASAVIMAEKYHAKNAVMVIQSFEENDVENHYADFKEFVEAYRVNSEKETPIFVAHSGGINLYVLWVYSKK